MSKLDKTDEATNGLNWFTLGGAARSCLYDIQESEHKFDHFLHFAYEGWLELHLDHAHAVKTVEIPLLPWKAIKFPKDMLDWSKVGFRSGNMIRVMTQDKNIPQLFDKIAGVNQENKPISELSETSIATQFCGTGNCSSWSDKYFGVAVNYNGLGYFRVDYEARMINFTELVTGYKNIYLEYITDGVNYEADTFVHPYLWRALKLFIHWQRKLHDDRYGEGERQSAQKLYERQIDTVDIRKMDLSIDDIREALRTGYRLIPKN